MDAEWLHRENARTARCLREAKLRLSSASLEDIDYAPKRELDKNLMRQLGSCRWVAEHQNVVVTGATGTGKTYVACALAQAACLSMTDPGDHDRPIWVITMAEMRNPGGVAAPASTLPRAGGVGRTRPDADTAGARVRSLPVALAALSGSEERENDPLGVGLVLKWNAEAFRVLKGKLGDQGHAVRSSAWWRGNP